MTTIEEAVVRGAEPFPPEVRQPKDYWSALCTMERRTLFQAANVLMTPEYEKAKAARKAEIMRLLDKHILRYDMQAMTPEEIVLRVHARNVNYVQIDVEGMDNAIVKSLPFGKHGFDPKVILYENHDGASLKPHLEHHGYELCCCVTLGGNNLLAVRKTYLDELGIKFHTEL